MDISKLDKAAVLAALYNGTLPEGRWWAYDSSEPMTVEEARKLLATGQTHFNYPDRSGMNVDLSGDFLDTSIYNRYNGEHQAERILLHECFEYFELVGQSQAPPESPRC